MKLISPVACFLSTLDDVNELLSTVSKSHSSKIWKRLPVLCVHVRVARSGGWGRGPSTLVGSAK